ncbi:MAG: TlpA disulfide reductase family protein [Chitinophagaceae bacterium]
MKVILFVCAFLSSFLSVVAQKTFILSGVVPALCNGAEVKLSSDDSTFHIAYGKVENGQFKLTGKLLDDYHQVFLSVDMGEKHYGGDHFFIGPGEMQVKFSSFKSESEEAEINYFNIPFAEERKLYDSLVETVSRSSGYLYNFLWTIRQGIRRGYNVDSLNRIYDSLRHLVPERRMTFIKSHLSSYYALHLFYTEIFNSVLYDSALLTFGYFDDKVKQSVLGIRIQEEFRKKKGLLLNNIMPDFSFFDSNGGSYKLSGFTDKKYILICFWSSGCAPCIKGIPIFKELYKQYESKGLQVISISTDKYEPSWKRALKKYELPWLQTCNQAAYMPGVDITKLYDVNAIPQYFLLEPNGKLVYQNSQMHDDENYTLLHKILKEQMP